MVIMTKYVPHKFIGEQIEVFFNEKPALQKVPGPPDLLIWREEKFTVAEVLSEWHDYRRRGRMARNMRPEHAATASRRGSWGVGQDYYRVRTKNDRIFDIYYDRAPKSVDDRKGAWFLDKELQVQD